MHDRRVVVTEALCKPVRRRHSRYQRVFASLKSRLISNPMHTLSSRPLSGADTARAVRHARGVCRTVSTRFSFPCFTIYKKHDAILMATVCYDSRRRRELVEVVSFGGRRMVPPPNPADVFVLLVPVPVPTPPVFPPPFEAFVQGLTYGSPLAHPTYLCA